MKSSHNEQTLILYGCGGHARSTADVAFASDIRQIIFVDEQAKENEMLLNFPVVKEAPALQSALHFVAIGDNKKRATAYQQLLDKNMMPATLIANSAYLSHEHTLGKNVLVAHRAHIGPRAVIGDNTIINTHCVIEHDCKIGKHSHISVNAVIAGSSQIGDYVMIGAGATVIDGVKVGSNITVGAGAVVVDDLVEPGVYVGVPARKKA